MAAAELDHDFFRRLIFDRSQALQGVLPAGIEFLGRQVRSLQNVGENSQCRREVFRQRGPAIGNPRAGDRGMMLDAQVVQVEDELPIVARSRPAERHLAGQRASPNRSAGSWTQPAGTRNEKAADCSQCIGWARSTRPLGKTCERIGEVTTRPRGRGMKWKPNDE